MAFHDLERKKIERAVAALLSKRRPSSHVRAELDFGYRISGQSVELFSIRPQWDNPEIVHEYPFAKATYVKTQGAWKIFWVRADLKWHGYKPNPTVASIVEFVDIVATDEYGCFLG